MVQKRLTAAEVRGLILNDDEGSLHGSDYGHESDFESKVDLVNGGDSVPDDVPTQAIQPAQVKGCLRGGRGRGHGGA